MMELKNRLSNRDLNRALLARQFLLERAELPVLDTLRHLVALQAQAPLAPYSALWARLAEFRPEQLAERLLDRSVVRIALMRSTIHLLRADDCLALRPLVQPALDGAWRTTYGRRLPGIDLAELAAAGRALVEARPQTFAELGDALAARWPGHDPDVLAQSIRVHVPLVQTPPRGVWGQSGSARHTSAEAWLGRALDPQPDPAELVRRYLAAFGPASVADIQTWTGLTRLTPIVNALRPELAIFRDEAGHELVDLPDAPRPDPTTPAPPRLLGEFDNVLLAHADRARIMAPEHKPRVFTVNGIIRSTLLVDGWVAGTWRLERGRVEATLTMEPFAPLAPADRAALDIEAARLLAFAAPELRPAVVVAPPT